MGLAVRLIPNADGMLDAAYAGEVRGYLVDEADDAGFVHTRSYAPTTNRKEISHDVP